MLSNILTLNPLYRIWDVECGACLRLLEGHEELVRFVSSFFQEALFMSEKLNTGVSDLMIKGLLVELTMG